MQDKHSNKEDDFAVKILESISDAFFSIDNDFVVQYFNNAAEKLLSRKRQEIIGKKLFDAFPEAKNSIFEEKYTFAIRNKRFLNFQVFFDIQPYRNWYDVRVYPNSNGISVYFQVITEQKRAEETIRYLAYHDTLTELYNRTYFYKQLPKIIQNSEKSKTKFALLHLDLDRFKNVNDTLGHIVSSYAKIIVEKIMVKCK